MSPVELVEAALARIERIAADAQRLYHGLRRRGARRGAGRPRRRSCAATPLGPLHGVPFAVKDLVNTAGVRTTFGSVALADNVPAADSPAVARLKAAGAILVGKTTTPEFGHKCFTEAPLFGRTANPWDLSRTCGGSSGGAAAAVAAGLGADRHRHRWRRVEPHPGRVLRRRRLQADAGPGAARFDAGRVRQPVAHHADDPHGDGHRADAAGDGRPRTRATRIRSGSPTPDFVAAARAEGDLKGVRIAWRPLLGNTMLVGRGARRLRAGARGASRSWARSSSRSTDDFASTEPIWLVLTQSFWNARFRRYVAAIRQPHERHADAPDGHRRRRTARSRCRRRCSSAPASSARSQGWFARLRHRRDADPVAHRAADRPRFLCADRDRRRGRRYRAQAWYPYTLPFNLSGNPAVTLPCGLAGDGLADRPAADRAASRRRTVAARRRAVSRLARPWADRRPQVSGFVSAPE